MGIVSYAFPEAFVRAGKITVVLIGSIVSSFFIIIKNALQSGTITTDVAGPVGVAVLTGHAAQMGFAYLIQFMALLSLNLAVINFLPFPALDGGRAFLFVLEAIRRRPVPAKFEQILHTTGFVLLITLVVLVTYRDVVKLF